MWAGLWAGPISLSPPPGPWLTPCVSRPPAWLLPSGSGPTRPCPLSQASACSPARPTRTRPGSFPPELWPIKVEPLVGAGSVSACCVRHPHKLGDTQGFVLCLHLVFYYRQAWWAVRKVEVRAELRCAVMRLRPHRWRCQDAQTALCRGSGSWCTSDPGAGTPPLASRLESSYPRASGAQ